MNLLNKKLKDKLKVLDDIDKQYIINIKTKNNNTTKNYKRNNNSSIEVIKKTTREKFDKVYSDFYLNENVLFNLGYGPIKKTNSMSNNLDKDPTNENSLDKEKLENNKNYSAEKFIQNGGEEVIEPQIEVGQRLYNYGIYLKNKLENQRRIQDNKIKQLTKPKISERAKSIVRNPEKFGERLYNNYKNNLNKNSKSGNKSCSNISNNDTNFSYHPKLNKKSILIANKLEPSFIRLNKKKKIKYDNVSDKKKYYKNLSLYTNNNTPNITSEISIFNGDFENNNNINKEKKNKNIFKQINNLYLRGIEQRKKKEQLINDTQKKKEEEYKQFPFKPKLSKNIYLFQKKEEKNSNKNKKNNTNSKKPKNNIYKKNFDWKKKIEIKNNKKKEKNEEIELKLCTFKPKLNNKSPHISKINPKVLDEMNEYINRRRKNIKYKIAEEDYKNRRLGGGISEYIAKSTIPHEFNFETEKRNRELSKNKNRSCENFHKKNVNLFLEQNSDNKSLNNDNFNNYWIFREDLNNCNSNNITRSSNKFNDTKSQIDFIEAVNLLHDKLDKLNI